MSDYDGLNVRDLRLLSAEKVDLNFSVRPHENGFILCILSSSGNHGLISQRGAVRIFKNLETVYTFLKELNVTKFEVSTRND